jgi:hypothetical protein
MHAPSLVGYTSSNKPIYQFNRDDPELVTKFVFDFSNADNFDAMTAFDYLQLVYWRRYGEYSQEYIDSQNMLEFHETSTSPEYKQSRRMELGLVTAFDLSNYGRHLCLSYLQVLIDS